MFVQCLGSSAYFFVGCSIFVYIQIKDVALPPVAHVVVHMIWLSLHLDTSLVYLLVNRELRRYIFGSGKDKVGNANEAK